MRRQRALQWKLWATLEPSGPAATTTEPVDAVPQRLRTEQSLAGDPSFGDAQGAAPE